MRTISKFLSIFLAVALTVSAEPSALRPMKNAESPETFIQQATNFVQNNWFSMISTVGAIVLVARLINPLVRRSAKKDPESVGATIDKLNDPENMPTQPEASEGSAAADQETTPVTDPVLPGETTPPATTATQPPSPAAGDSAPGSGLKETGAVGELARTDS